MKYPRIYQIDNGFIGKMIVYIQHSPDDDDIKSNEVIVTAETDCLALAHQMFDDKCFSN